MNTTTDTLANDTTDNIPTYKRAHIWQIGFFSLNTCATNLYLAMMAYVSYYANGIAGISVVMISLLLTVMRVFNENAVTIHAYLDVLRHNRPIQMLVIAASTDKFASVVYSHAAVTVMMYGIIMNNYSIYGLIGIITAIPSLGIVVFGISLARHFGQRRVLIWFTWASIVFQTVIGLLLLSDNISTVSLKHINLITILFFTVFAILNGCKSITNNMVIPMIADCTDYELYRSGRFVPGLMGALFSFVDNFVSSLGTAFVGIMLSIIGFGNAFPQVGDAMTPLILWSTIFFYCITPIIGWIISLISMQYYRLDRKRMEDIVKELNKSKK